MLITKLRTLGYIDQEWGTYVERFNRLPQHEQEKRIRETGYASLQDLLAHILAWWDEGMGIILAIAEDHPFERKKYDFDSFNAEAVAKYKTWDKAAFLNQFEQTRQKMEAGLRSMSEAVYEHRRVQVWLRAIIVNHARDHLITLSRFLAMDVLLNDWATYIEDFDQLNEKQEREFLSKQGFASFHDLLAHIVGWWEEGARIISGILDSPAFTWESRDVDAFNRELTQKYSTWSDDDLFRHYETVRLALIDLIADLPRDAFLNADIEGWIKDDVVEHYNEHPIPA